MAASVVTITAVGRFRADVNLQEIQRTIIQAVREKHGIALAPNQVNVEGKLV